MVVPTVYGNDRRDLYFHGSVAGRSLIASPRTTVCVTVTHIDGLVLARSVFEHGVNYRSAMIYGVPRLVTDAEEKLEGLRCLTEQAAPAQWDYARRPNRKELAATVLLALSARGSVGQDTHGRPGRRGRTRRRPGDLGRCPPLVSTWGEPETDPLLPAGSEPPDHIGSRSGARLG